MTEARFLRSGPQLTAPQWQRVLMMLLVVQLMLILPIVLMLPGWLAAVPLLTGAWQWQVIRGRWHPPGRAVRWTLVLALPALLLGSGLNPGALDFYVALSFIGVALKLLEMQTYRDAWLVSMLAFFVLAALLLLDQGIFYTLYVFLGGSVALAALLRLHAPNGISLAGAWRNSARAVLMAVPFMLLLFVAFPRLPPIWQMPTMSDQARTGLSDSMSTGSISELVESNELIFRARFDGDRPSQSALYWRAMTLTHFDGERWRQWPSRSPLSDQLLQRPELPVAQPGTELWNYEVVLSPTWQPWVATLENLTGYQSADAQWARDNRLVWREQLRRPTGFTAQAAARVENPSELSEQTRDAALQLPEEGNPRLREQAAEWFADVGRELDMADRIMRFFAESGFSYSLRPGVYEGPDGIDEFLFSRQTGFCAHYAEAMVLMLRSVDIPARVVTGYLGGQWNEDNNYLVVRAREAHAWVELWTEEQGWVRYDPTAVVAPDRLTGSLSDALGDDEESLSGAGWGDASAPGWLQRLYWQWDNAQYQWQRWVLNFDADDQASLLDRWFGHWSPIDFVRYAGLLVIALFSIWYGIQLFQRYGKFWGWSRFELLARRHCRRHWPDLPANEGLTLWADRLEGRAPDFAAELREFAADCLAAQYGPPEHQAECRRRARKSWQRLRRQKASDTG
ncbi:MAG: DUF3488 and transglutaminase-like domain-containing protein [Natronospirillum sp.]|uniref:transglutaminase family protein n=1 Tax=Natronospirillum sp. TaxID=2812955 RepID=UPI0025D1C41F|nr:DUF3488 and transglutaminase-like domain-containing protein [Natronospirillum sp.]MCH8551358.1 DUF3488 and transglutaminase-like domain-containing protein [Natronospirillum sp.]